MMMARTLGAISRNPTRSSVRHRLWCAMRMSRDFTITQLRILAEAERDNAQSYVRALTRHGYLGVRQARVSGVRGGDAVYRLIRDTGPECPRLTKAGGIFDANTGEISAPAMRAAEARAND